MLNQQHSSKNEYYEKCALSTGRWPKPLLSKGRPAVRCHRHLGHLSQSCLEPQLRCFTAGIHSCHKHPSSQNAAVRRQWFHHFHKSWCFYNWKCLWYIYNECQGKVIKLALWDCASLKTSCQLLLNFQWRLRHLPFFFRRLLKRHLAKVLPLKQGKKTTKTHNISIPQIAGVNLAFFHEFST